MKTEKIEESMQCLICQGASRSTKFSLTATQIGTLWKKSGKSINHVILTEMGSRAATLFECAQCGFRYFDPILAGSGMFYDSLKDQNYYVKDKPEYDAAFHALSILKKRNPMVMDVGCGNGAFLDLVTRLGAKTYGTEINEASADEAAKRGHKIFRCLLEDVPNDIGMFDFISMFQVLEHVPDPLQVVKTALEMISPGGQLLLAVPNDLGLLGLAPFSPYQWPPHHISRWRKKDLLKIAKTLKIRVVSIGQDPLITSQIRHYWGLRRSNFKALRQPCSAISEYIVKYVSYCLKILGVNKLKLPFGHSIWIILQK
jgi:SAM-dependent methyltransferase